MLDIAVAYNRYKFLGHEFLTWMWHRIDNDIREDGADSEIMTLSIGSRIVIENCRHNREEVLTIRGDGAGLEEGLLALNKGGKVTEMHLIYRKGELEWRFTIKGESLNISSLKCPQTGNLEKKDEVEGAVLERIYLVDQVIDLVNGLYCRFVRERLSSGWEQRLRAINEWIRRSIQG